MRDAPRGPSLWVLNITACHAGAMKSSGDLVLCALNAQGTVRLSVALANTYARGCLTFITRDILDECVFIAGLAYIQSDAAALCVAQALRATGSLTDIELRDVSLPPSAVHFELYLRVCYEVNWCPLRS